MLSTQFLESHLSKIHTRTPIDTLIAIGAGQIGVGNMQVCLGSDAKTLVLTEADPVAAVELNKLCEDAGESTVVHLHETAIAEQRGQQTHHIFSLTSLSGLHPAPELQQLFPGLRKIRTEYVRTETISDLLRSHPLVADACNILVIGVIAEGGRILEQLSSSKELALFSHIFMVMPPALEWASILDLLQQDGWEICATDTADPDFPSCLLQVNTALLKANLLEKQLVDASELRAEQAAELEKLRAELDTARQDTATQTAEREAELKKLRKQHQIEIQEMKDEVDLSQQSLTTALRLHDLRETDLRELQLRYGELKARKEAQDNLLHRLQDKLRSLLPAAANTAALPEQDAGSASGRSLRKEGNNAPASKKKPSRSKKSSAQ